MSTDMLQVLVIDDNEASAKTLAWAIEMLGCKVNIATSGKDAIKIAKEIKLDRVVMDIGLPDINGFEVCKILKEMPQLKETVFIAQTGWSEEKYQLLAKEVGFNHYLVKPLNIKLLMDLVAPANKNNN